MAKSPRALASQSGLPTLLLGGDRLDLSAALFFVVMLSLLTLLHDRYLPVHAVRVASVGSAGDGATDRPAAMR